MLSSIHGIRQVKPGTLTTYNRINEDVATIVPGAPVKLYLTTGCRLAQANSMSNIACGLVHKSTGVGSTALIISQGILQLSDWTAVIGAASLTENVSYYLSVTAGHLTDTPSETPGNIYQPIGYALSVTELYVQIQAPILM